jgi:hemolysin III
MYKGERFNSYSHLAGVLLAIAGLPVLLTFDRAHHDVWKNVSFSIYGSFLILLYLISTLYHTSKGRTKKIFQKMDHLSIYLLIAGTYTPFTLVTLRGAWGWSLFGVNWGLALVGIIQELWVGHRTRLFSMFIYLIMGWLIVLAIKPLYQTLNPVGFWLLVAGGVCYTGGVAFFLLDEKMKHAHGIWHLFVLAGSLCQYFCVLLFV